MKYSSKKLIDLIEKYKGGMKIHDSLAIERELTELKYLEESYKVRTEALERMTKKYNSYTEIKNMSFSEKLKFLLNN